MNFFKKLFKTNTAKDSIDSTPDILLPQNDNIEKETFQEIKQPQIKTRENPSLTEEERKELIVQFATEEVSLHNDSMRNRDPLFEDAVRIIVQAQFCNPSLIQIRLKMGFNRAGRILEELEERGIVGMDLGNNSREVLIRTEAELNDALENGFSFYRTNKEIFYDDHKIEIEKKKKELLELKRQENIDSERNLIKQDLLEKERKKRLQREVYKELLEEGSISISTIEKEFQRELIPQDIMDKVWNRDSGRCVKCGSQESLEFDHIIPFSRGGANTYRNLQILCKKCNIEKSNKIG